MVGQMSEISVPARTEIFYVSCQWPHGVCGGSSGDHEPTATTIFQGLPSRQRAIRANRILTIGPGRVKPLADARSLRRALLQCGGS